MLFCYYKFLQKIIIIIIIIVIIIILFFHKKYFNFFMFRDVPEYSVFRVLSTAVMPKYVSQVLLVELALRWFPSKRT